MMKCGLVLGTPAARRPASGRPDATTPQPVAAVEVPRYLGAWHEVARLPMWAQDLS